MSYDDPKVGKSVPSTESTGKSAMGWAPFASSRNVHVDVFAKTNDDGFVEFSHKWKLDDETDAPPDLDGMIDLPAGKTAYKLHFRLHDSTRKDLSFKSTGREAMWVAVGEACPTGPGNGVGQIQFNEKPEDKKLIVDDVNSNDPAMIFKYALRFDGKPGQQPGNPPKECPPYEYDPEFKNGGGNN